MTSSDAEGVLLLDKPAGWTSTKALAKAKRVLGAAKAGHTGTLDPFATGLLPLVFGEATKFARFLIDSAKSYSATLRLGVETTTGDTEGVEIVRLPVEVDTALVDAVLERFVGRQEQVPPMHSAVRVGGRRLYEMAREGVEIERASRTIEIHALRRQRLSDDELVIDVACSKGTYVRTLARDIGRALGCGAYLSALRRTAAGSFRLEDAATLDELEQAGLEGARARLLPLEALVAGLARWDCAEPVALRFTQGQQVEGPPLPGEAEVAVFGQAGRFLGVARAGPSGRLVPVRLRATGDMSKSPDFS